MTKFSDGELPSNSLGRDQYIAQLTPVSATPSSEDGYDTDFTAQSSRFALSTTTPVNGSVLATHMELDFLLAPGGNEAVSNSFQPRLRRAYVDYKGWRVGQEWTTFQALQAIPESASFYTPAESQVFVRQPMIRYTSGNFQFALENPNTNVMGVGLVDDGVLPDAIARYNFKGDNYNVALSAIARQLRYETPTIDGEAFGFGVSVAGRVNLGKDDVRFSLQGGEGLGRYVGLGVAPGAVIDASGTDIEAIPSVSGNIAYRKSMGDFSLSGGYSFIDIDNDIALTGTGVTSKSQSGFIALTKKIAPKLTWSGELLYGEREIESGLTGDMQRFTFSVRQGF